MVNEHIEVASFGVQCEFVQSSVQEVLGVGILNGEFSERCFLLDQSDHF
jgi:hypothetical protein